MNMTQDTNWRFQCLPFSNPLQCAYLFVESCNRVCHTFMDSSAESTLLLLFLSVYFSFAHVHGNRYHLICPRQPAVRQT